MDALRSRVSPDLRSQALRQRRIPSCAQGNASGHDGGRTEVAHPNRTVSHPQPAYPQAGYTPHIKTVDATQQVDFLFQIHLAKNGCDSLLYFVRRAETGLRGNLRGAEEEKSCKETKNRACVSSIGHVDAPDRLCSIVIVNEGWKSAHGFPKSRGDAEGSLQER